MRPWPPPFGSPPALTLCVATTTATSSKRAAARRSLNFDIGSPPTDLRRTANLLIYKLWVRLGNLYSPTEACNMLCRPFCDHCDALSEILMELLDPRISEAIMKRVKARIHGQEALGKESRVHPTVNDPSARVRGK